MFILECVLSLVWVMCLIASPLILLVVLSILVSKVLDKIWGMYNE